MPCSVHDLMYMPYMYKGQVERLNLFTENSTMFGDEECFGVMS